MGAEHSVELASYECILGEQGGAVLINTLSSGSQSCLIAGTVPAADEERHLNTMLDRGETDRLIIVYGKNCVDKTPYRKNEQLTKLGFSKVAVYPGGMLEWSLLQDAYGCQAFSTTSTCADVLAFAPNVAL
jgi:hypothetical protein